MKRIEVNSKSKLILDNIRGFIIREVVPFGNSAKVSCPKEYLGKKVYLVIIEDK